MREILLQFMGEEAAMGVQFLLALLAVLLLFGLFIWLLRMLTGTTPRKQRHSNERRLAVLDRTQIDETRSLLLVRRDDVEHLVMVGGPSDVVVEANINLDEEDEETASSGKMAGHEIARRVIAQRPLRTMSLAGSSPSIAESIGLTASSTPEATIAPPPPPLPGAETVTIAEPPAPVQQQVAPVAAPTPVAVPEPRLVAPVVAQVQAAPAPIAEPAPTPVVQPAAAPEPRVATVSEPQPGTEVRDLASQLEEALMDTAPSTPAVPQLEEPLHIDENLTNEPARVTQVAVPILSSNIQQEVQSPAPTKDEQTMDDQNISTAQDVDLSAGFAAAMALEPEAASAAKATNNTAPAQAVDEVALEDAIADMLRSDGPAEPTYNNVKNDVYSSSESEPTGSERFVDTTRPGRVDDEMSRLLQELAVPGRA